MTGSPQPGVIEVDIHGMTCRQARIFLENQIRKAGRGVYRIRVIHGYHGGTGLRDMVRGEIARGGKVLRAEVGLNQGETDLVLRELF